ncbi:MAG: LL-diaminopimelate aminotransferase [Candidatus Thiodiazotropha lotti]|uniref:LL-diaminopimelate aminotransferase n=1 Tax=Candidatus Thiodiazotropha endoloripes TaxID=1818881 RepID=A0A1E2UQZ9_9GAMM|nr:LL-diaminopimelate aminotransferase [Candidatus Thiodiazotropha endoloripes]MCG7896841.1 LL-diaminopimelate aminotransferase [Candidatus Thiodiazotropha weberae]MCG7990028.1 LL-diaminopimelate aminotransferase [Candidatus Thiodiazotropha lotti]MCG7904065.1 LL-diaminopimelate aminotransferase [Candidatus Thiodiazotropha weberae]MCG7914319.1 LL-diaminopimelate aminotransferase [Candidatus Thiodiazotropha weberae]MCG8000641.1 LL-diaminopimelate aminotransferase [Candidatus Thiodiazotropha lott
MIKINENYKKLQASYLFSDIAKRVSSFQEANPDKDIIRLGIGDVTRALPEACVKAFHAAVDEMAADATFHGYGPEQGYDFLRQAIAEGDYQSRGCNIATDEVFVSDGAKCDSGNFQEIFADDVRVAIPDPVYPVYVDTNVMAGRTGAAENGRYTGLTYLDGTKANGFIPALPTEPVDLIYLCFPNNPTGATATKAQLKQWVDYAKQNKALILFDAAYEAFVQDPDLPRSIFEIEGAREVAVEFRSFSKNAGFTGTRCAYTVVPKDCTAYTEAGEPVSIHELWNRRHTTKFNSVSYPVQKAAAAVYTAEGQAQVAELVAYYMKNAKYIREQIENLGYDCIGGENSPYIWIDAKGDSWDFFDTLLNNAGVVCTPGAGFGKCGEGYIRISAFNSFENVQQAMERVKASL